MICGVEVLSFSRTGTDARPSALGGCWGTLWSLQSAGFVEWFSIMSGVKIPPIPGTISLRNGLLTVVLYRISRSHIRLESTFSLNTPQVKADLSHRSETSYPLTRGRRLQFPEWSVFSIKVGEDRVFGKYFFRSWKGDWQLCSIRMELFSGSGGLAERWSCKCLWWNNGSNSWTVWRLRCF